MKKIFSKIKSNNFIKISSFSSLAVFVRMITNLISVKVVAVIIGPPGMALLGQLQNFNSICMAISTAGIKNGVVKYVSEFRKSGEKLNLYIRSATGITILFSMISGLIIIVFSHVFSVKILHSPKYSSIFIIFGFTIILYALNSLLLSIINGHKEFKKFVLINITASTTGLLFSVCLVLMLGIYGALLSLVTYQSVVILVSLLMIKRLPWFNYTVFFGRINRKAINDLSKYSLMTLISVFSIPVAQILIRNHIITNLSQVDAGIWEGINRISGMYLRVITSSIGIYYLPRLSELIEKHEIKSEIINAYKVVLPFVAFITIVLFIARRMIIKILFSADFYQMENLFLFQFIGDFFKISSWLLSYQMLAKSMTKTFIVTELIFSVTFVSFAIIFINYFGIIGATYAYALNYLLYLITMLLVFRKLLFK